MTFTDPRQEALARLEAQDRLNAALHCLDDDTSKAERAWWDEADRRAEDHEAERTRNDF